LRADYQQATADLDFAVADYNDAIIGAVHDTADRLTQIQVLDQEAVQQTRFSADAALGYKLAETSYLDGIANQLTLLNAEALLLQARQQQAALDAARAGERVHLILAIGGGVDPAPVAASSEGANP